ncbi:MAG TPA: glycosyltransferase, partial [Pirellulales bacterium]|nr:glycosyltransferase [Pirellulales bacterium]
FSAPKVIATSSKGPSSNGHVAQRVGIVANLRPIKNIELFVRAAGRLAAAHPNAYFEIGGEGESRGLLQALIDNLGLGGRVTLRGSVSDVPTFLRGLDVAVLCSLSEGSPNAIMEYMAAGLPTVATDVGGNAELVEHEVTGLVVPSNNEEQLAGAIDRLLRDPALAAQYGNTARERAFASYGVEDQARRYEDFYCRIFARKTTTAIKEKAAVPSAGAA